MTIKTWFCSTWSQYFFLKARCNSWRQTNNRFINTCRNCLLRCCKNFRPWHRFISNFITSWQRKTPDSDRQIRQVTVISKTGKSRSRNKPRAYKISICWECQKSYSWLPTSKKSKRVVNLRPKNLMSAWSERKRKKLWSRAKLDRMRCNKPAQHYSIIALSKRAQNWRINVSS